MKMNMKLNAMLQIFKEIFRK